MRKLQQQLDTRKFSTLFREDVIQKIIDVCTDQLFKNVTDFEWLTDVLLSLMRTESLNERLSRQLSQIIIDVAVRVPENRHYLVEKLFYLLEEHDWIVSRSKCESLCGLDGAYWVIGEFAMIGENCIDTDSVFNVLLMRKTLVHLPINVRFSALMSFLKYFIRWTATQHATSTDSLAYFSEQLELISKTESTIELTTVTLLLRDLLSSVRTSTLPSSQATTVQVFAKIFETSVNPIAEGSQELVEIPEGLDLNQWIGEPWIVSDSIDSDEVMSLPPEDDNPGEDVSQLLAEKEQVRLCSNENKRILMLNCRDSKKDWKGFKTIHFIFRRRPHLSLLSTKLQISYSN